MRNGRLVLALAFGSLVACGDGGGGGGGGEAEVCPGTSAALVGACHRGGGSCREYRGELAEAAAREDCAQADEARFTRTACPADAHLRGSCSGPMGDGTAISLEPRAVALEFKLTCIELGGCYDPTGRDDGACYGTGDVLVGSCRYDSGRCLELRGAIEEEDARAHCAAEPAGTFREAACPASARASGSCSNAEGDGTAVLFHEALSPEELEQLCDEWNLCFEAP